MSTSSTRRKSSAPRKPASAARRAPFELSLLHVSPLVTVVVLLIAWLYLRAEWMIAGEWGYALDDSWIYATFARNLATGHGFTFNTGESVAGTTGPLYTLILALFYFLFHEVIWSAKVFGVICHIGASVAVYSTALALLPGRRPLALTTALMVASAPPLAWAMLTGMEISLYLLLVCVGLAFYVRSRHALAILFWSVGVWARPDGLFLVALGILGPPREMVKRLAVAAPILIAYFGFNAAIGGHWMPQTVGAKARLGLDVVGRTWLMLREWGELWGVPFRRPDLLDEPIILLPFFLLGAAIGARRWPILLLYAIGFPLVLSLFEAGTSNEKRYILYVIPFSMILAAVAWDRMDRWRKGRLRHAGMIAAIACLAIQASILPARAEFYGWNVQNINKMQVALAKFVRVATRPGDAIATNDIGAMGYFSDRYVVDLVGLVSPIRTLPENLGHYKPKLLAVFVPWFQSYARDDPATGDFKFFDPDSSHRYELLAGVNLGKNTICGANRMGVYVRLGREDASPTKRYLYAF